MTNVIAISKQQPPEPSFLSGMDYMALPIPERPYLIEHLIPEGGLVNLFAEPKAGKSYLALQMASAVSSGDSAFLGFKVKPARVAYFQLDTPRSLWVPRVRTLHEAGLDMSNIYFCDREMPGVPYPFNIVEHQKWLTAQLADIRPELLFVDTLREVFNGNENDSDVMKLVISSVVAAAPQCAIFFLSHRKKALPQLGGAPAQPTDLMNDNRGSTYIPGRMDVVMCCTPDGIAFQGRAVPLDILPARQTKQLHGGWALDPVELAWRNALAILPPDLDGERSQARWIQGCLTDQGVSMSEEQIKTRLRVAALS